MRAAKVVILEVALFVCLLAAAGAAAPVYAAGPKHGGGLNRSEAEGRKHARKANQLADVNKCKAAIPEYTKAMRLLKDPTLLFNRGECYRRTGEAKKAIADYRKFLIQLPSAPNRALVESQIAALENKKTAPAVVAAAPAINHPPVARAVPPPPPAIAELAPSIESPPPPAPVAEERQPAEPMVPEHEPEPAPSLRVPPPAPEPVESPAPMAIVSTKPVTNPAADTQSSSSYWWIWVLGAVVVVGAGAGAYFALKQGGTDVPPSALGNYRF